MFSATEATPEGTYVAPIVETEAVVVVGEPIRPADVADRFVYGLLEGAEVAGMLMPVLLVAGIAYLAVSWLKTLFRPTLPPVTSVPKVLTLHIVVCDDDTSRKDPAGGGKWASM